MPEIVVKPVDSRREKKMFLGLPWQLYKGDPNWIPPLRLNQKELVGYKKHPFHDVADLQTFLAVQDGKPVGRIAAIHNHVHNERHGDKLGFFGFFESIDNQEVANKLFDAAVAWLKQRGLNAVRGPMNPSFNYESGLLIEGFDTPPTFMMTYNPRYYEQLVDSYGFRKEQDLYAYWGHIDMLESLQNSKKMEFTIQESIRRFNFKLRRLDTKRFKEEIQTFLRIYNDANSNHWSFVPLSDGEIAHQSKGMKQLIVPEMTSVAEVDGRVVGTVFGMLDYNPRIKEIDGRLFPFGFIKLLTNRRALKRVRLIAAHVLPEYQRWGLGLVLLNRLLPDVFEWGIEEGEFSWVAESNDLSRKSLERGGAKRNKTYRVYDLEFGE